MKTEILNVPQKIIKHWIPYLSSGIIFILIAICCYVWPEEAFIYFNIVISLTFFFSGVLEIISSIQYKVVLNGWKLSLSIGILEFFVGIILILHPQISTTFLTLLMGFVIMCYSVKILTWSKELEKYEALYFGWFLLGGNVGIIFSFLLIWRYRFIPLPFLIYTSLALLMIGISQIYFSFVLKKLKR